MGFAPAGKGSFGCLFLSRPPCPFVLFRPLLSRYVSPSPLPPVPRMSRPPHSSNPATAAALSPAGPYRSLKQAGLVVLCIAWALLGVIGHDPWKTEDATAFGVAWEMMRGGSLAVPSLAGEPYTARPPLIYALAAGSGRILGGVLPAHDAARIAAALLLWLTLLAITGAGIELNGRRTRWLPVLLFIGCVGLWDRARQLAPELGLLLGVAGAHWGLALAQRRPAIGGAVVGAAGALAFLAHGLAGPLWIGATQIALAAAFARYRSRSHALATLCSLLVCAAIAGAWVLALLSSAPDHLANWWARQVEPDFWANLGDDALFLPKNLLWFAWPVAPLVLWTLWMRGRGFNGGLRVPAIEIPATFALVMIAGLALLPDSRTIMLMPLLIPLCLIAAIEVDTLKRGFSAALDWFGILTFGLLAGLVWWLWIDAWLHGLSPSIARLFRDTEAGYRPEPGLIALAIAVFLTALWLALVRPARRSNRRAVLNWAAGMTLVWGLYTTIWLPYLDSRRSYRTVAESLAAQLPASGCVASRQLGEPQRALFRYFAGLQTVREERQPDHECSAILVQYGRIDGDPAAPEGFALAWEGRRRGDDSERFVLYRRQAP